MLAIQTISNLDRYRTGARLRLQTSIPKAVLGNLCLLLGWLFVTLAMGNFVAALSFADERRAKNPENIESQIVRLIRNLDSPSFAAREAASSKLSNAGSRALRPLAINALHGTPEAAWRTQRAIESIAVRGNEDNFFKSVGILKTLYFDFEINQLQAQWKLQQKYSVIKRLRDLNAIVVDPGENRLASNTELRQQILFGNNIRVMDPFANPGFVISGSGELRLAPKVCRPAMRRKDLDERTTISQIDKILVNDIENNRELAIGKPTPTKLPDVTNPKTKIANVANNLDRQIAMQRAIMARPNLSRMNSANGISVRFTDQWSGSTEDIAALQSLPGLSRIELVEFNPGKEQLSALAKVESINAITIAGAQIPNRDLTFLESFPKLRDIDFENRPIDADSLSKIASLSSLGNVTFRTCDIEPDSLQEFANSKGLRSLFFNEMHIDSGIFESLRKLKNLNYVNLSICKFETVAFKELVRARPSLQIVFTPQAFLGVRGPIDLSDRQGCQISAVIAGSGAEQGGMQIGDVIKKVNGQVIQRFEDLRLHIAQHKAGETLNVVVVREKKEVDLKITLTRYDDNLRN